MKNITVILNPKKKGVFALYKKIKKICESRNLNVSIFKNSEKKIKKTDLVITIGGDGTLLMGFHLFPNSALLGIHMGHLGFLAHLNPREVEPALENVFKGKYTLLKKRLLTLKINKKSFFALNEFVLTTKTHGRLIEFFVYLKGETLHFLSDGFIFSTPTGSTAYNFAAMGPIVDNKVESFIINPLAPHNISFRPIVLPMREKVGIELGEKTENALFWIDGQKEILFKREDRAVIHLSEKKALFVEPEGFEFNLFKKLKDKLRWHS